MDRGWGAPLWRPPGGFLSSASPGRGPGVVLCDAGPQGGSAYLAMGAEGSSPFPEDFSHQLAGLNATLPSPRARTCQRGQGRQGGAGSLCQGPHLSLGLGCACAPASKLGACHRTWPTRKCVAVSLLVSTLCLWVFVQLCAPLCRMWGSHARVYASVCRCM